MSHRAVIFDLDGTLLDTLEDIAASTNRVLASLGFPIHPHEDYRYFVGEGVQLLMMRALPEDHRDEATVADGVQAFREDYGRNWNVKTKPYGGIPEMLDGVAASGLKMTVLSNKPDRYTKQCVAEMLPNWKFEIVLGARDGTPRKPDPTAAFEIARDLDLPPSEILFLGDTAVDMRTAVVAGMFPVGALWGFRPREELLEAGARVLIDRPAEFLDLLSWTSP